MYVLKSISHVTSCVLHVHQEHSKKKKEISCVNVGKYLIIINLINLRISRKNIVIIIG